MTSSAGSSPAPEPEPTYWGPIFTIPNIISFVRLACIPLFVWLLFGREHRAAAAWLLAALGATDWVDGWIARRFDQVSELGKVLDPTADRMMFVVAIPAIAIDGGAPGWFATLTVAREVVVGVAAIALAGLGVRRIDVTWWGKTGTFLLMFAFPMFLGSVSTLSYAPALRWGAWLFGLPGLAISWYAAGGYVPIALQAMRERNLGTSTST
ncbi:MAG: CDP-alcohol phosphatidyltransferase family protein [Actinomycetia bacterium]|nr:CDP-alcohol phosphatidyltransferase family protein [Actinomycetes bacterium]MCP3912102.1 CDP-alcohol phosphatidyltransferase family protein [Actinomycetes bacterium]MCP4086405.1 CDP-alcohol phosphatidyltransferase family protein [Actinomycetes bacterium]